MTDHFNLPPERPSRLAWWLHPKVALPLMLLVTIVFGPFLYRGYRIASVPDIGDPFDVEAFGTVNIAPADNAMTQYAVATAMLRNATYPSEDEEKAFEHGWSQTSEVLRKWLDDNQPALAEWRKGTERSQAVLIQPKDFRYDSMLEVIYEAWQFSRLSRLQAERCAHDGDIEAAWGWHLAAVRASRHVEQNGGLIQRLGGIARFDNAADGIKRWAEHPAVSADLLRKSLSEFREADQLTPLDSVAMKIEYLALRNTLRDSTFFHDLLDESINVPRQLYSSALFVMGEPELSLRVFQHVFRNQLSEIDKPKRDRAPIAGGMPNLYDLPVGAASSLPARELDRVVRSAHFASLILPAYAQADIAMQREAAKRAAVSLILACQLHHRLHGDWPAKVEDLVPEILTEPQADPLGKSGETMRLKRDGHELLIYSVGTNGIDDGGNFGGTATRSADALDRGYRLQRPSKNEDAKNPEPTPQEKP